METNGISLNNPGEKKNDRRSLIIGVLAGIGIAALVGGAFVLGGRSSGSDAAASSSVGQAIGSEAVAGNEDAAANGDGGQQGGGEPDSGQDAGESNGGADEPTVAPEEPQEDDPTATPTSTPTNTPTNTPTATPTPDFECVVCPDGLGLSAEEPVVPPCGEGCVIDGGFQLDLPELAFEETSVKFCAGYVAISAEITGHGEIWVTYEKEYGVTTVSEHQFPESFFLGETGTWAWFGSWGWIYPYDFVFHAEDAEGNHIEKAVLGDYVC